MITIVPTTRVKEILRDPETGQPLQEADHKTRKEVFNKVLEYGIPSMGGFVVGSLNELVDTFWLAKIGAAPVAAVTMFMSMFWALMTVNILIGVGSSSVISRRFGEKEIRRTERAMKSTMLLKLSLGTITGVLGFFILGPALRFMGAAPDVHLLATEYAGVLLICSGTIAGAFSIFTFLRCIGRPRLGLLMQALAAGTNMIFDPLLIFGWGPFPEMGILGAAVATAGSFTLALIVGMLLLTRKSSPVTVNWFSRPFPKRDEMMQILRIGWPVGINVLSFSVAMNIAVKIVAVYGTNVVALYGAAMKVLHFGFMSMVGFTLGTSALLGQYLGSKELLKAWMVGAQAIRLAGWIMLAFGGLVFVFASPIIRMFFDAPEMHDLGTDLLRIMAISLPLSGMHIGAETAFEGAGMNKPPMILSLVHAWLLVVPFMYILGPVPSWGPHGVMWGWAIAHSLGGVAGVWLFQRGAWLKHEV